MTPADLATELHRLVRSGALDLPRPAAGRTAERHRRLAQIGAADLALARLAEAHSDAVAILAEAGREPATGASYGVWAADDPSTVLRFDTDPAGGGVLDGAKAFCTGAGIVDRALVTVPHGDRVLLVDVDLVAAPIGIDAGAWITPAFAATSTATVSFARVPVPAVAVVGPPGWYLARVGFWHGACGPAACWAGGAIGLVDQAANAIARLSPSPHRDAHLGALTALRWQLVVALDAAGGEIDRAPDDRHAAQVRALALRHGVERAATEIVDRVGRALGPRPLAFDASMSTRIAELQLYIRQCHAERDLEVLGRLVRTAEGRGVSPLAAAGRRRAMTTPEHDPGRDDGDAEQSPGRPDAGARPDPEAPGNYVDDPDAGDVPEPNEPG